MDYAIETVGLCKRFPGVIANDDINLKIQKGKVHAVVGENGAGKTTLMNMLYGLYLPSDGEIKMNGKTVNLKSPNDAMAQGVGMVHQHFMLIPRLTVYENIVIGKEPGDWWAIDKKKAIREVEALSERYNLEIDPNSKVEELSVGAQQRVEILKALYRGVEILILDEPTAVLTPQEIEELFEAVRFLISKGKTVIIITHKLDEVMQISDQISVLRKGKHVATVEKTEVDVQALTMLMVGRDLKLGGKERKENQKKTELLKVIDLTVRNEQNIETLHQMSFCVNSGEIIGIAGVDGNGQTELVEAVSGLNQKYLGKVWFNQKDIQKFSIRQIRELGLGFIPEDRHKHGLLLKRTIDENMVLGQHYREPYASHGVLNSAAITGYGKKMIEKFDIRTPGGFVDAGTLSGGNQQKIIIARELDKDPSFILAVQPTRGLDVGAIEFVHNTLVNARNEGKGILLVSLELEEVMMLCDRIIVINKGEIVGEVPKDKFDKNEIGAMMLGLGKGGGECAER